MNKLFKKYKWLKKYLVEIILLTSAFLIALISLFVYLKNSEAQDDKQVTFKTETRSQNNLPPEKIFIDVSGAVNKPDLYEASSNTRLKDIIEKAGGLSDDADKSFFARNFNLARIVVDQEKIYVPSVWEVNNGYFTESQQTLNYISPAEVPTDVGVKAGSTSNNQYQISINSATLEELDQLQGIGQATAQKIINNRPYQSIDELLTKKVVNKSVFEKIKNLVDL